MKAQLVGDHCMQTHIHRQLLLVTGLWLYYNQYISGTSRFSMAKPKTKSKSKGSTSPGFNKAVQLLLHLTAVLQFNYGVYIFYTLDMPNTVPFAGKFKFLTFICAVSR